MVILLCHLTPSRLVYNKYERVPFIHIALTSSSKCLLELNLKFVPMEIHVHEVIRKRKKIGLVDSSLIRQCIKV